MMKLTLLTLLFSVQAFAGVVTCQDVEGHKLSVRLSDEGTLADWSKDTIVSADTEGPFAILAQGQEEGPFEYYHSVVTSYGAKILIAGTSFDEGKLAVFKDLKHGYFAYRDLGSGNGNTFVRLTCEVAP